MLFTTATGAEFNLWGNSDTSYSLNAKMENPASPGNWIQALASNGYLGSVVSPPPPPPPAHPSPNPVVLTFEEVIAGTAEIPIYSSPFVSTQGYKFATVGGPATWVQYLSPPTTAHGEKELEYRDAPTLMTAVDGSLFNVTSLDAATGEAWTAGDTLMVLTGTRKDGSQVEATLGIGLAFQSFTLVDFTNLISLQFSKPLFGGHLGIDNIAVGPSAVPEPATWALMVGGLGLVGRAMRRRRKGATDFA